MPTKLYQQHQEYCDHRRIVDCTENGVQYRLRNDKQSEVAKIKIDGGVFPSSEHKKCDFLLIVCNPPSFGILVELKGSDCKTAIKQIHLTLDQIKIDLKSHEIFKVHGRIAMQTTKHTQRASHERKKLDQRLKNHFRNGTLKIQTSPFEDSF